MDYLAPFFFLIFSVILGGAAFALMWKNLTDINRSSTRRRHPEVAEIKDGDQLLVAKIDPVSCDLEEYGELQARIRTLKEKLEDLGEYDDEDEDEDGDLVVRR